jgi:hypothetical protein
MMLVTTVVVLNHNWTIKYNAYQNLLSFLFINFPELKK